jgi:hypothetical protein
MQIHNASAPQPTSITEQEIREVLLGCLTGCIDGNALVREEFRLERGGARIDVAVIDQILIGYEIKSDADTFTRFPNQIHAYNRIFDEIHLVCGGRHVEAARHAIPSWWGLSVAKRNYNNVVYLDSIREAGLNPSQDSFSLASLLWRNEALEIIGAAATGLPKQASSHALWEFIAASYPLATIKDAVKQTLLNREFTVS